MIAVTAFDGSHDPHPVSNSERLDAEREAAVSAAKAALKDAARAWLPDEVIDRPKASFGVPLRAWVGTDLKELVDDTLLRGELVGSGFLRPEPLQRLVDDQRAGRRDESKQIWQLLCLEYWYRNVRASGVATA